MKVLNGIFFFFFSFQVCGKLVFPLFYFNYNFFPTQKHFQSMISASIKKKTMEINSTDIKNDKDVCFMEHPKYLFENFEVFGIFSY